MRLTCPWSRTRDKRTTSKPRRVSTSLDHSRVTSTDDAPLVTGQDPNVSSKNGQDMGTKTARVLGAHDGRPGFLGSIGVRFMIDSADSGGAFSLVEHPMSARALGAPLHRHTHEDEFSYVIEGRVGALLGDEVVMGGPGDLIFKPRNQWHTFWNAGEESARILEIISPAGFERYFAELVELGGSRNASSQALRALGERYRLEVNPQSIPELLQRFGLRLGEPI
jgi:quercetin dioxygenase-like cupin family protein